MGLRDKVFSFDQDSSAQLLIPVTKSVLNAWLEEDGAAHQDWVSANKFKAAAGSVLMIPSKGEAGYRTLVGIDEKDSIWAWAGIAANLPAGAYQLPEDMEEEEVAEAILGWALGQYSFDRYKTEKKTDFAVLIIADDAAYAKSFATIEGISLTRDLINTPAQDMGPAELEASVQALATQHSAEVSSVVGDDLLSNNYPMIHAVGRAAIPSRAPRLIELTWGDENDPKVTLVGKGVCFDSGGLDIKSAAGMVTMKKDMGGAANLIGLAHMIMATGLKIRLTLLVSAVENAVSGDSFRPMDILTARDGTTVEIGNTDAEGRLVLGDAIVHAGEEEPDLILDMATLTGAARVALGTDMPGMWSNSDAVAAGILEASASESDPLWRMPLHQPYRRLLDNKNADISNISGGGYGGAITAALFLEHFVPKDTNWVHIDLMAWNLGNKPGKPEGGEAQGIRAIYGYLASKYQ